MVFDLHEVLWVPDSGYGESQLGQEGNPRRFQRKEVFLIQNDAILRKSLRKPDSTLFFPGGFLSIFWVGMSIIGWKEDWRNKPLKLSIFFGNKHLSFLSPLYFSGTNALERGKGYFLLLLLL